MNRLDRAGHKGRSAACWVGSLLSGVADPLACPKTDIYIYHGVPWTHVEIPYVKHLTDDYHFMSCPLFSLMNICHGCPWSMAMIGLIDFYGSLIVDANETPRHRTQSGRSTYVANGGAWRSCLVRSISMAEPPGIPWDPPGYLGWVGNIWEHTGFQSIFHSLFQTGN